MPYHILCVMCYVLLVFLLYFYFTKLFQLGPRTMLPSSIVYMYADQLFSIDRYGVALPI